ncbi:MAG: extracellular solute-binding protein, partial [Gammaproteobacteria bacterium]
MRRIYSSLSGFFALALLAALVATGPARGAEIITYVSWGGAYLKSQLEAYLKPYTAETGVRFDIKKYTGGLEEIKAQVESGKIEWQLVDMEAKDLILGCDSGLLERIDHSMLPPSDKGKPASEDFITGALHECGVGTVSWATIIAYDDSMYPHDKPADIKDFWNTAKFPGRRGLRKTVDVNLEWALIADGVSPDNVYDVLATPEGIDR